MSYSDEIDYEEEREKVRHIAGLVLALLTEVNNNPVIYPEAVKAFTILRFGRVPKVKVDCETAKKTCLIEGKGLVGGLDEACALLFEAFEALNMECNFEEVDDGTQ